MNVDQGRVAGIFIAPGEAEPVEPRDEVEAVRGRGLRGDRYFLRTGAWSDGPKPGREVTLIESEAVAAARQEFGLDLKPEESRRNIVTEGVPLNHLVGRTFRVGGVVLRGFKLAEPCTYLEGLTRPGVRRALVHRAGLRAEILEGGSISVGDAVEAIDELEAIKQLETVEPREPNGEAGT